MEDEDTSTTKEGLKEVEEGGKKLIPSLPVSQTIATFLDCVLLCQIEISIFFSPLVFLLYFILWVSNLGTYCFFWIAEYVGDLLHKRGLKLRERSDFIIRSSFPVFRKLPGRSGKDLFKKMITGEK